MPLAKFPARAASSHPLAARAFCSTGIDVPFRTGKYLNKRLYPEGDPKLVPGTYSPESPPPYRVHRSRMGNLPIYSDTRGGGVIPVTVLRKFHGDMDVLSTDIGRLCKSHVKQFHGRIEISGRHVHTVKEWLAGLGF